MEMLFLQVLSLNTKCKEVKQSKLGDFGGSSKFHSLADLHPDKMLFFLRCHKCQKYIQNLGPKGDKSRTLTLRFTMEQKLKFTKINALNLIRQFSGEIRVNFV